MPFSIIFDKSHTSDLFGITESTKEFIISDAINIFSFEISKLHFLIISCVVNSRNPN